MCHPDDVTTHSTWTPPRGPAGVLVTATVIGDEVAAEEQARTLLRQRDRILDQVPVGVFRVRLLPDGDIARDFVSNRATELLGSSPGCLLASCVLDRDLPPQKRDAVAASARGALASDSPLLCDERRNDRDQWIRTVAHVSEADDGGLLLDGIVEDITLTKLAEAHLTAEATEAAERADHLARHVRVKSALLSALGHDLRTPLAVITSSAAGLQRGEDLTAEQRAELVGHIQDAAQALDHTLENLLDLHRIDVGALEVALDSVDLLDALEVPLRTLGVSVEIDITDDFPPLLADLGLLERVLDNLLNNAVRHCAPGTPLAVIATRHDDRAVVRVVDRGNGVHPDRYPELFEPYRTLHPHRQGLGVGLSIAQTFTQAMGMTLTPTPTAGGGLTMTVEARIAPCPTC